MRAVPERNPRAVPEQICVNPGADVAEPSRAEQMARAECPEGLAGGSGYRGPNRLDLAMEVDRDRHDRTRRCQSHLRHTAYVVRDITHAHMTEKRGSEERNPVAIPGERTL